MKNLKNVIVTLALAFVVLTGFTFTNISGTSHSISGHVDLADPKGTANGNPIDIADAFTHVVIASGFTDGSGNYNISGITGTVEVIAFPSASQEANYAPTVYGTALVMNSDKTGINIQLQLK